MRIAARFERAIDDAPERSGPENRHVEARHIEGISPGIVAGEAMITIPRPMIASASEKSIATLGRSSFWATTTTPIRSGVHPRGRSQSVAGPIGIFSILIRAFQSWSSFG